ncbi:MAG TPA: phosphate ABC transporter ATP-binding protein [Solirubrobacteraceae bacterium]|jgi:phosphate transport system ATP-binding protein|nr:phosphate ABC transporter ATP-binding protein [Solirubrobacteraceae bacterium]
MSPDEMLLDALHETMSDSDEPRRDKPRIASVPAPRAAPAAPAPDRAAPVRDAPQPSQAQVREDAAPPLVPPVRTIVVDRAPEPVLPLQQRAALRAASSTGPERLRLEDVSIDYGVKRAVRSVSLSIHQGEVLALIGPSGCGKTTLLRTLNRLTELTPSASRAGSVLLDGEDIHEMADTTLRSRVAMVFQQPNPFPMSIFDNVAFALREQSRKRPRRRELEPLVIDALRRAGLYEEVGDELDRPALRLSGGQQQRLCIARAIAPRPEVLLMDEPCSALDPISTATIEKLIGELRRDLAVVVVTHNLAQAHRVADKVAFMYLGDLVEYGTTADVFDQPRATRTRDYVRGAFG